MRASAARGPKQRAMRPSAALGLALALVLPLLCAASRAQAGLLSPRAQKAQQRLARDRLRAPQEPRQRHTPGTPQGQQQGLAQERRSAAQLRRQGRALRGLPTAQAEMQALAGKFTREKQADAIALLAFRKANWDPNPQSVMQGWVLGPGAGNGTAPPPWCSWEGITCSNTSHRVTGIDLYGRINYNDTCTQSLPPEMGNLIALRSIDLSANRLCGSLPSTLMHWAQLTSIRLAFSGLKGSLSPAFGQWAALEILDLSSNAFGGSLPAEFGNWRRLKSLNIGSNSFEGSLPSTVSQWVDLEYLGLSYNRLKGPLPPALGQLTGLSEMALWNNRFSGTLPSMLGQLTGLTSLVLSYNCFSGSLPNTLGRLTGLISMDLSFNSFNGSLPATIGQVTGLASMDLSHNSFSGALPAMLSGLTELLSIDLSHNSFQGSLPSTLTKLMSIDLSHNAFALSAAIEGPHVDTFGALCGMTGLTSLVLSGNSYQGSVPACLGGLGGLKSLGLARLNLSGQLDTLTQLNALTRLSSLDLSGNSLRGTWHDAIGHMPSLTSLNLSSNPIAGTIPDVFGRLLSLSFLHLAGTELSGSLPPSLGLLKLVTLEVPDTLPCPEVSSKSGCSNVNLKTGEAFCRRCAPYCSSCPTLPRTVAVEAVLEYEGRANVGDLRGVLFSGNGSVETLRLATDDITFLSPFDPLPLDVLAPVNQTLKRLTLLGIAGSDPAYAKPVPDSATLFTGLEELTLQNLVKGSVPRAFSALERLTLLDLSFQFLSGSIGFVERLSALNDLNLASNRFSGSLPPSFKFPPNLVSLDLSSNQFTGALPQALTGLTRLTKLDVHDCTFEGSLPSGLASLPLAYFSFNSSLLRCPDLASRPARQVLPSSAFCQSACPAYCKKYAPPPLPPPPPVPPPPSRAPSPPPAQDPLGAWAIAVIAVAAAMVAGTAIAVACLLRNSWRESKDDVEKRGIRRFAFKELEDATQQFSHPIGGDSHHEVFLGTLPSGRRVVVKCQGDQEEKGAVQKGDFRSEIKLLSGVHHRHLIALLGYCLHRGRLYLVEEFAERGSLKSILQKDPASLPWERRLEIALGVARGLDYLHSQIHPPIIHGDIQSSKVLITEQYEAKLGGFEVSAMESSKGSAQVPSHVGYMDPERLAVQEITAASDVYSLGVVLAELATGWQAVENGVHILDRVVKETARGSFHNIIGKSLQPELGGPQTEETEDCTFRVSDGGDSQRGGKLTLEGFAVFVALTMRCCSSRPARRPTAHQVVQELEELLEAVTGRLSLPRRADGGRGNVPFPWYHEPKLIKTEEDMFGSLTFTAATPQR